MINNMGMGWRSGRNCLILGMEAGTKVNIIMVLNMGMDISSGMTVQSIGDSSIPISSMDRGSMSGGINVNI